MYDKLYHLSSEVHWSILNNKINKIEDEIKQIRKTSVLLFIVFLISNFINFWINNSYKGSTIIYLMLSICTVLWAITYIVSLIPFGINHIDYNNIFSIKDSEINSETSAMLYKDMERLTIMMSRKLRILRLYVAMSTMLSAMLSILLLLLQVH